MKLRLLTMASTALLCSAAAQAQISDVPMPFVGDASEGFEGSTAGMFSVCIQPDIFNGDATLCSTNGSSGMHVTGGWSFRCQIPPHSGTRFFGSAGPPSEITFMNGDATQFGGYFGTNSWQAGNPNSDFVTVEFFDAAGTLLGSRVANVTDNCTWTWNGWASSVPIHRITIANSAFGGGFVDLDDLEVTYGPVGLGTNYCSANANSTGQTGDISASGSNQIAANNVVLEASDLPLNAFGYFLTSMTQGNTPNPGGSQGVLCLGGNIGRYTGAGQIKNSGSTGEFSLPIDLTQVPTPTGFVSVMPAQTWNFTAWYRDSIGGNATSNFTDGLSIQFN